MRIAIIGCGFVADYYVRTLAAYPELQIAGVLDRDAARAERFAAHHSLTRLHSLEQVLEDPAIALVVNLTNPRSHVNVSRAALEAGKHVYSEKPLAMDIDQARELVELSEKRGLLLSSAPCTLLGETAQAAWRGLRDGAIGRPRLVYAEMDDGLVHRMQYRRWQSESGNPWPYRDEFEVGCTIEHAGYYLTWLPALFGPARRVTAFSSCLVPEKAEDLQSGPDFSVACIAFDSGVVARLTCSIVAPHDHSLRIIGDDGVLRVADCWDMACPVTVQRSLTIRRRTLLNPWKRRLPLSSQGRSLRRRGAHRMDYGRGIAALARAIEQRRPPLLSARFSLHVNELVLAIQNATEAGTTLKIESSFEPMEPLP